jgi:hypothetical protein
MSRHAPRAVRDHFLAAGRVDAPISSGGYRSLFEDLPDRSGAFGLADRLVPGNCSTPTRNLSPPSNAALSHRRYAGAVACTVPASAARSSFRERMSSFVNTLCR